MRLIDADALKEKKVYSHERHEKIVPVAEIDWSPTIDAIPVAWLNQKYAENEPGEDNDYDYFLWDAIEYILTEWQKEQEAR